jgi:hypothetical protein
MKNKFDKNKFHIFTPYKNCTSKDRVTMWLDTMDIQKIQRGYQWDATVTNQETGKMYKVRGADCGAPGCYCAAEIVTELHHNTAISKQKF